MSGPTPLIAAPWTAVRSTPHRSARQAIRRRGVIIHHHAGTNFTNLRNIVQGTARQVSYTAICDRGQLELMVPNNNDRPWSASTAYWDSAMRSVCLNNLSTQGWTVHDDTVSTAARAVAYWASREGWWPHRDGDRRGWTVIGHGELRPIHGASIATACPGGVPLGTIVSRAQSLLRGQSPTPTPPPPPPPLGEDQLMFPINWHGNLFLIGPGQIHHFSSHHAAYFVGNVTTVEDQFHYANNDQFTWLLQSFDVPWYACYQAMNGNAPGGDGKTWSRGNAAASRQVADAEMLAIDADDVLELAEFSDVPFDLSDLATDGDDQHTEPFEELPYPEDEQR